MKTIGCVQHDCPECKAREAQTVEAMKATPRDMAIYRGIAGQVTKPSLSVEREALRQRLGEALTEVLTDENAAIEPDWFDDREIDRVIDAILPAISADMLAADAQDVRPRLEIIADLVAARKEIYDLKAQQVAVPQALTDDDLCAIQCADQTLQVIAERSEQVGDVIEPINDIRAASSRAKVAYARFSVVARKLFAQSENQRDGWLAAAPQPPQAERVPMTNSEIITAAESLGFTNSIAFLEVFELGVECAEAHHHIGGKA